MTGTVRSHNGYKQKCSQRGSWARQGVKTELGTHVYFEGYSIPSAETPNQLYVGYSKQMGQADAGLAHALKKKRGVTWPFQSRASTSMRIWRPQTLKPTLCKCNSVSPNSPLTSTATSLPSITCAPDGTQFQCAASFHAHQQVSKAEAVHALVDKFISSPNSASNHAEYLIPSHSINCKLTYLKVQSVAVTCILLDRE